MQILTDAPLLFPDTVFAVPLWIQCGGSGTCGQKTPQHAQQPAGQQTRRCSEQVCAQVSQQCSFKLCIFNQKSMFFVYMHSFFFLYLFTPKYNTNNIVYLNHWNSSVSGQVCLLSLKFHSTFFVFAFAFNWQDTHTHLVGWFLFLKFQSYFFLSKIICF